MLLSSSCLNSNAVDISVSSMGALEQDSNFLANFFGHASSYRYICFLCFYQLVFIHWISNHKRDSGDSSFLWKQFYFPPHFIGCIFHSVCGVDLYCNRSYVINKGCVFQTWSFVFFGQRKLFGYANRCGISFQFDSNLSINTSDVFAHMFRSQESIKANCLRRAESTPYRGTSSKMYREWRKRSN